MLVKWYDCTTITMLLKMILIYGNDKKKKKNMQRPV